MAEFGVGFLCAYYNHKREQRTYKVDKVIATIKYSQGRGKGAWNTLEIGAEGSGSV